MKTYASLFLFLGLLVFARPSHAIICDDHLLSPYDHYIAFQQFKNPDNPYHLTNIPVIDPIEIKIKKIISKERPEKGYSGEHHKELVIGEFQGKTIFVKYFKSPISASETFATEIQFAKLMSAFNIGPKFLGVIKRGDHVIGIMTEFIDGQPELHGCLRDIEKKEDSDQIFNFLESLGISPGDLQYRMDSSKHLWIVDMGWFAYIPSQFIISQANFEVGLEKLTLTRQKTFAVQAKPIDAYDQYRKPQESFIRSFLRHWF